VFDTRIFHKEANSLARAGYDVTLIAQHGKEEIVDGIRIIPLPKPKNRFERMTRTVWQAYRRAHKIDADVYHFHDPELIPIGLLLKLQGRRVIYDVHEDVPRQILSKKYIPRYLRHTIACALEKIENFATKQFDAIITATPFIRDRFIRSGCCAIDVNNFPILSEWYILDIDWSLKERAVCYSGCIADIRGIFEMIEAIDKTNNVNLLITGWFSPANLKNQLVAISAWANVVDLGQLNQREVAQILYKSMAGLVLLHPIINYLDALPVKMFEYIAAGIPVIASNFPLWKEIVEGAKCGICVDPLNSEEIAVAIRWIIEHPSEAEQMGKNGRRAVEERYNWDME